MRRVAFSSIRNRIFTRQGKIVLACVLIVIIGIIAWRTASAATATLVPQSESAVTGWAAGGTVDTTCAGGTLCDRIDDGLTDNTNDFIQTSATNGSETATFNLGTATGVESASGLSVRVYARASLVGRSLVDTITVNLIVNGTPQTLGTCTPGNLTWAACTYNVTQTWSQADVNSMQIRIIRNIEGSSGSTASRADTTQVANITGTLTYTPSISFEQSAYRWFNNQDSTEPLTYVKTYGGTSQDRGYSVAQTSDGGFVSTGDTYSFGDGNADLVLSKHDKSGALLWTKAWGGAGADLGYSVAQTSDGGYVVTGQTSSYGAGGDDVVVIKFTASGTLSWSKTWGDIGNDYGQSLVALGDGSIVVTGWTDNRAGQMRDIMLLKFASDGTLIWEKNWGTSGEDYAEAIVATSDGGFAVSGHTNGSGAGDYDQLILKFTSTGALSWNKTWGGAAYDDGYSITQLSDNGILVAGSTSNYGTAGDVAMVKYDSSGNLQWSRTWGGGQSDQLNSVVSAADGGFVVAGQTRSFGAGDYDLFAAKYSSTGTFSWNKTWGGTGLDTAHLIRQTADNGFVLSGYSTNYGTGNWDSVLVKYDSTGTIDNCSSPMCQTPSASTSNPVVTVGTPAVVLTTPGISPDTVMEDAIDAAYVESFVAGKYIDVGSPLSTLNTVVTAPSKESVVRLRMNVHVGLSNAAPGQVGFKLQYVGKGTGTCVAPVGGSPASYTDVTTSTFVAYADNPMTADGTPIATNANDPTHGADSIVRQTYEEKNNLALRTAVASGQDGQWDLALKIATSAPDGARYCLRIVKSDGSTINSYGAYPEIIVPATTIGQSSYRFYQNQDSSVPGVPLAAQSTASTTAPSVPFRLRQRLAVDGSQIASSGQSFKLQYAEKASTCSASFGGTISYVNPPPQESSQWILSGQSIANDSSIGTVAWLNLSNLTTDDNSFATVVASSPPQDSNYIKATNYGFNIPADATIDGIDVFAETATLNPYQLSVRLVKGGVIQSVDRANTSQTYANRIYGSPTDLWGDSWTPADINNSGFGVAYALRLYDTQPALIDYIGIEVYYTPAGSGGPATISFFDNAAPASGSTITASNDPTGRTTVYQTYNETDPYSNSVAAIAAGSDGLWDFSLTSSPDAAGKTYCFRTVKADGTPLDTYSTYPEITFAAGNGPSLSQQVRGGASVVNGTKSPLSF